MTIRFGTDLQIGDPLDGHTITTLHRGVRGEIHVTLDNGTRRSFSWNQQVPETMAERCGFNRTENGGCACRACGRQFPRADGSVMRSHAKRVHGVVVAVPARCDA